MARRAFLLGGSGQTGRALVPKLLEHGWEVTVASRGQRPVPAGAEHVELDRGDDSALRAALARGAEVLVDFIAFEPEHAEQLLSLHDLVRSVVVVSSAAVYFEAAGPAPEPPDAVAFPPLPVPLTERSPTAPPGLETYATKKASIERTLLANDHLPATLIRAGAIHGPGSTYPREWHFVKRVLDGRRAIVLAWRGRSRFQPISVHNLAELIWLACERPGRRVLNAGDPEPPTVLEISRLIASRMGHEWAEVLIEDPAGEIGRTPWSVPHDCVLEMTEAQFELGYRPVTTYGAALPETIEWLVEATRERAWQEVLPRAAEYMKDEFDYGGEDALLRALTDG